MIITINKLPKWNGHLYNWYDIKTLKPLVPKYISTVDSGNFISYIYVLKQFYIEIKEKIEDGKLDIKYLKYIPNWVDEKFFNIPFICADFTKLFDYEKQLFSIGFNEEENMLTNSYYDLLASEARNASLVAISKKDVEEKHWYSLGRTLTTLNGYKGLISWSGTSFEYLMPNIIVPKYTGSILDESCRFMIMSQKDYAKKLNVPWGFSETAFNIKDLNGNYQYKAIGIPWLGLKRGLEDDITVSSYGSIMAICEYPKDVIKNIKILERKNMRGKYGLYESIDFTPERLNIGKKYEPIKTFMAHHEGLILISINNLLLNNVMQNRFMRNEEIKAIKVLLEERMPKDVITTNEKKIKPSKIKYIDDLYTQRIYTKPILDVEKINLISNDTYSIILNQKGEGYSKINDIFINRFKENSDEIQGIFFFLKDLKTKKIWTPSYINYLEQSKKYEVKFSEDVSQFSKVNNNIQTKLKVTIDAIEPVEIRNLNIKNIGKEKQSLEIISFFEPVLSRQKQDYMHPAFNNLFLIFDYIEDENILIVKRKKRLKSEEDIYLAISFNLQDNKQNKKLEFEIDKEKFFGRGNISIPKMIKSSIPFSNKIKLVLDQIVALKRQVQIAPFEEINVNLILGVGKTSKEAINRIKKYETNDNVLNEFEVVKAKVDAEARYLRLNKRNIQTFQEMLRFLLFTNPFKDLRKIDDNRKYPQKGLWQYGISGDLPIILFEMENENDNYVLKEIIKAYEYFRYKNVKVDLVIVNKQISDYENSLKQIINNEIIGNGLGFLLNVSGGIFVLDYQMIDLDLIKFRSNLVFKSDLGSISRQINDLEEEFLDNKKIIGNLQISNNVDNKDTYFDNEKNIEDLKYLKFFNGYGGFNLEKNEYKIKVNNKNRLPTVWSNILANEKFGCITTEAAIGYTWSENSRLNKLSSWSNNQVVDFPSEGIYIQDMETTLANSISLNPMPDENDYFVDYGFGYSKYKHLSLGIKQNMTVFVPKNDSVKINIINLKNMEAKKKKIRLLYYLKPVLDEDEEQSKGYIEAKFDKVNNIFYFKNLGNTNFDEEVYISSSENMTSYSINKNFFIGKGNLQNPDVLKKISLDNSEGIISSNFISCEIRLELEAFEDKNISLVFGREKNIDSVIKQKEKYIDLENVFNELEKIKKYWQDLIGKVKVKTPDESFNILINGPLIYQIMVSRLYGRTGFYQSGGAFGFRDQLQDMIGLKHIDENLLKNQIIKHAKHQFIEGDVEHWWHDDVNMGIRTRFSDDLLWLPYMVYEYIIFTKDYSILNEKVSYKEGKVLQENEDEKYDVYEDSDVYEDIFMHALRAIEKSLNFGENGLPKIGSGDWNDGLNTVGNKGKGESVWLGFFLYENLKRFIQILNYKVKIESIEEEKNKYLEFINKYERIMEELKVSLNTIGWDGKWYKRAYTDDGKALGTKENDECEIDGISQSWSVISEVSDENKKYLAMESLDRYLVDKENKLIKLLDPPFEKGSIEPGYIKSYIPGIRENGGQYTHGAIWAIIAFAKLGLGDKAVDLFKMINPIEHTSSQEEVLKYKVEPYVIAADVYTAKNLIGRGGWTWYTGSSSWMYEAGLSYILGLKIINGYMEINPCISSSWKEYQIQYKYKESIYNIKVFNNNGKNIGVQTIKVNGNIIENKKIPLIDDGKIYKVEVYM